MRLASVCLLLCLGTSTAAQDRPLPDFNTFMFGHTMGLEFTVLEVSAVMLSVMAVSYLVLDGRTNWFEGVQLLAIYTILAMTFYFL